MRSAFLIVTTLLAAAPAFAEPKADAGLDSDHHLHDIIQGDPNKSFNIDTALAHRNVPGTFQSSKSSAPKEFYFEQKFSPKGYETREFGGTKSSWFGNFKFATKDASTKGAHEIPNATKAAEVKTAPTKEAREVGKMASTRELVDAHRPYLGKEAEKLHKAIDPKNLPPITRTRTTAEDNQELPLHELKTVDDVKTLLNKN